MLGKNSVRDECIDYKLKIRSYYWPSFIASTTATGPLSVGVNGTSADPEIRPLTGSSMMAVRFSSVQNVGTAPGLEVALDLNDFDNQWPLYTRVWWTTNGTEASIATQPVINYATLAEGVAPPNARTALTIAIATSTKADTTARTLVKSAWGQLGPLDSGANAFETFPATVTGVLLRLQFSSLTNAAVATDFLWVTQVDVAYTPNVTGYANTREAKKMADGLANIQAGPGADW